MPEESESLRGADPRPWVLAIPPAMQEKFGLSDLSVSLADATQAPLPVPRDDQENLIIRLPTVTETKHGKDLPPLVEKV